MLHGGIAQLGERLNGIQEVGVRLPLSPPVQNPDFCRLTRVRIFVCTGYAARIFRKTFLCRSPASGSCWAIYAKKFLIFRETPCFLPDVL